MYHKVSKEQIMGFYVLLTLVLAFVGYFVGRKHNKGMHYALMSGLLGVLISVVLWFTVGKKMVGKNL